jgi:phosphoglycerol transferase MdoB-like AlkP superfamily enzyme
LQFYAQKINTFPQPFMTSFFSLSSHHPFKVPEAFEGKFKGGPLVIHACIEYTDYALRKYFETVSKMPWYKNTLFVITADHTSSEIQFDKYRTAWGLYSIPIIFFKPDNSLKGRSEAMVQQIDIMPSVLGYLHYDRPYLAFGRNVFDRTSTGYAFNFYNENTYQLFRDDFLFQHDGQRPTGLFNFKSDPLLKENLLSKRPDLVGQLEPVTKAFIQQYNNRLIDNKLVVE